MKTKLVSKKKASNPWFTPEISKLVQLKSVYFNMLRLELISKEENNCFKNRLKSKINKAKATYYKNLLNKNFGNMRSTWKTLNFLMDRNSNSSAIDCIVSNGIEIYDASQIATIFNDYFLNVVSDLNSRIPDTLIDPLTYINFNPDSTLNHCRFPS